MRHIKSLLALCLLPVLAHAQTPTAVCQIKGKVLEPTSTLTAYVADSKGEHEQSSLVISMRISKVTEANRMDNHCQAFHRGQKLTISIQHPPRISLAQGQTIRVDYWKMDNSGVLATELYRLLEE